MKYRIYRKTRKGKKDRTYTARFSGDGVSFERGLGVSTKDAAEYKARQLLAEYERREVGLSEVDRRERERARPIVEHVEQFIRRRKSEGRSPEYVRKLSQRLTKLIDDLGLETLAGIQVNDFDDWLADSFDAGNSSTTNRHYADAFRVFLADMQRRGYVSASLVESIPTPSRNTQPVRDQRPFTDDELRRLGQVDPEYGPIYVLMAFTGLRRGEMEQITTDDLILDLERPTLRVQSHVGKSRRHDSIPLLVDALHAARTLRAMAESRGRRRLIPTTRLNHRRLDAHLEQAGIEKIDSQGRFVAFHSFRRTLADMCIRHRITPAVAKRLLRHRDIRLTMDVYGKAGTDQTFGEASAIPPIGAVRPLSRPRTETTGDNTLQQCAIVGQDDGGGDADSEPATARTRLQQYATKRDGLFKKWSRGESNPRADTAGTTPLRV